MFRLRALSIALALLATAPTATAESSYSLSYRAADGCPTREDFIAELGARSPNLREATNGAPDVSIEIWFEGDEPTNGILLLRDTEGRPTLRTIPGATCAEVVAALALTASLLADAQRRAPPVPDAPPSTESPVPPTKPATTAAPVIQSSTVDSLDEGSESPAGANLPSTFRFHVGMGAAVEQGVAPSVAFAGALELGVEWSRPHLFQPLISVTLERTLTETVEEPQGDARFRWTALRLGFCPFRLASDGPLVFRTCGLFEAGAIEADGVDVPAPDAATVPWWAAGVSGRLELEVLLVELGGRLQFTQDRFYFDPDSPQTTLFEVPPAGLFGRAGVQGRF